MTYQDTNSAVTAITGNNQWIVQNQSSLQINFTSATAQKYATISSYQVTFNGQTQSKSSSGTYSWGSVNSSSNLTLQVKVVDSRGNSTTISKTVTCLAWQAPAVNYIIARVNNFESTTNILVNATISSVNSKNSLQLLQYRTKKTSDSSWSPWIDIPNNTKTQADFDNTKAFNFQIRVQDRFASSTYEAILNAGQPLAYFDTKRISVGINVLPTRDNYLQAQNIESIGVLRTSSTNTGANYIYGNTYFSNPSGSTTTTSISNNLSLSTAAKQYISQFIYPVGAIYMSINSTNPSSYFGGTWSLWGSGRVPVCVNTSDSDFSSSEKSGGTKTVTLTTSQMPSHDGHVPNSAYAFGDAGENTYYMSTSAVSQYSTNRPYVVRAGNEVCIRSQSSGGGNSHSNLQPYITCYMWKRTA